MARSIISNLEKFVKARKSKITLKEEIKLKYCEKLDLKLEKIESLSNYSFNKNGKITPEILAKIEEEYNAYQTRKKNNKP